MRRSAARSGYAEPVTDESGNIIDFRKVRLRKQASESAKNDPPTPEISDGVKSHEEICEWITAYLASMGESQPENS